MKMVILFHTNGLPMAVALKASPMTLTGLHRRWKGFLQSVSKCLMAEGALQWRVSLYLFSIHLFMWMVILLHGIHLPEMPRISVETGCMARSQEQSLQRIRWAIHYRLIFSMATMIIYGSRISLF